MFWLVGLVAFLYVVIFAMILKIAISKSKVKEYEKLKKANMRKEVISQNK